MTTSKSQVLSGSIDSFAIYTTIDITVTNDYSTQSQRRWDAIIAVITMRAQPVLLNEPVYIKELSKVSSLVGPGYTFNFSVEHDGIFAKYDSDYNVIDPIGMLRDLIYDIRVGDEFTNITPSNLDIKIIERTR